MAGLGPPAWTALACGSFWRPRAQVRQPGLSLLRPCSLQLAPYFDALAGLPALATLDLRCSLLWELPAPVQEVTSLTALLLSGSSVRTLPEGPYLRRLERLDLGALRHGGLQGLCQLAARRPLAGMQLLPPMRARAKAVRRLRAVEMWPCCAGARPAA